MSKLRAAVIGTGFIGPVHVEALGRAGIAVAGILGSNEEKSERARAQLGLPRGYGSLDELLADDNVDVVHVTSPNQHHFSQVSACLRAGKHVLCEKPLAMNAEESSELVNLARKHAVAAGVNYNIRYYPLCVEAAARVSEGVVGELFHVSGGYVQDWLFHETDFNWRVLKEYGGELRAVGDIGTHWLDLLQFIVGKKVESVCADLSTVYPVRRRPLGGVETFSGNVTEAAASESVTVDTEDYASVLLRFSGGMSGVMTVSQVTAGRKNCLRFELAGSNESLAWNSESPNEMWIGRRDQPNQSLIRDPALVGDRARAAITYPGGHNEGFADTFKQLFLDFYDSIETQRFEQPSFPSFEDGHHELLVCEAILASHRQRGWVAVGEK